MRRTSGGAGQGQPLRWVGTVRCKAKPVERPGRGMNRRPVPTWIILRKRRTRTGEVPAGERDTGIPVDEPLDVLVYCPADTCDVSVCYDTDRGRFWTNLPWFHVRLVPPAEADPPAGKIDPEFWPSVTFLEGT